MLWYNRSRTTHRVCPTCQRIYHVGDSLRPHVEGLGASLDAQHHSHKTTQMEQWLSGICMCSLFSFLLYKDKTLMWLYDYRLIYLFCPILLQIRACCGSVVWIVFTTPKSWNKGSIRREWRRRRRWSRSRLLCQSLETWWYGVTKTTWFKCCFVI